MNIFKNIKYAWLLSQLPSAHLHTPCLYWVFPLPGLRLHHHHPVPSHCRCRYHCLRRCWRIEVSPAQSLIRSRSLSLKHNKVGGLSYDPKLSSSVHSRWMLSLPSESYEDVTLYHNCSHVVLYYQSHQLRARNQTICFIRAKTSTGC